jgi:hypothetical protein
MKGVIMYDFGGRTVAGTEIREVRAKYRGARASMLAGGFRPEHARAKSGSRGRVKKRANQNAWFAQNDSLRHRKLVVVNGLRTLRDSPFQHEPAPRTAFGTVS